MRITLGKIELARGLARRESPAALSIRTDRETQESSLLRGATARHYDRGNRSTRLRFTVTRRHDSSEAAASFALTHAAELDGGTGDLVLTGENGKTRTEYILSGAVVNRVTCEPAGLLTSTAYEIHGGAFIRGGSAQEV